MVLSMILKRGNLLYLQKGTLFHDRIVNYLINYKKFYFIIYVLETLCQNSTLLTTIYFECIYCQTTLTVLTQIVYVPRNLDLQTSSKTIE